MGSLEYMIGSAVIDAATKQQEMQTLLNGKTPEQQAIIKFFYGAKGGCLSSDKGMTVEEYRKKVREGKRFTAPLLSKVLLLLFSWQLQTSIRLFVI